MIKLDLHTDHWDKRSVRLTGASFAIPQDCQICRSFERLFDTEAMSGEVATFDSFEDMPPPPPPSSGGGDVFLAFDEPPALLDFVSPVYPPLARDAGIEGTVAIRVLVDEQGKVISADVLQSDVTPAMERAALAAAKKCRFRPAKQRTIPVKAHVMIPFQFQLTSR